jgi:hypothetical protein
VAAASADPTARGAVVALAPSRELSGLNVEACGSGVGELSGRGDVDEPVHEIASRTLARARTRLRGRAASRIRLRNIRSSTSASIWAIESQYSHNVRRGPRDRLEDV